MLKRILPLMLAFVGNYIFAQKNHFILVENKTSENIMLKCNDETFDVAAKEYTTISKLNIGTYMIDVFVEGKVQNTFKVDVLKADRGFDLLKNDNEFLLKDIHNEDKIDDVKKQITKEEPTSVNTNNNQELVKKSEPITSEKKNVDLIFSKVNNDGIDQIYVDGKDTISIYIPNKIERETPKTTKPDVELIKESKQAEPNVDADKNVSTNKNCFMLAEEFDVKTLTAKIIEATLLKDKIKNATTAFKQKCYNTNQVKRLSVLFNNDANKFTFFKATQPYISDIQNFEKLASELKDEAVIAEFNEFVKQL